MCYLPYISRLLISLSSRKEKKGSGRLKIRSAEVYVLLRRHIAEGDRLTHSFFFALFAAVSFFYPSHALAEEFASVEQNYRFLEPLPQAGKGFPGSGFSGNEEQQGEAAVQPLESGEEQRERSKIRNLLRLVDGDTVTVSEKVHVQLLGVQFAGYNTEDNARYEQIIKRIRDWLGDFMENPESALKNYEGMNSQVNYNSGKGTDLSFFYLYVPDFILEEIRRNGLAEYDDWLKKKNVKSAPTDAAAFTLPPDTQPTDTFKSRLLNGKAGEKPGEVKEYLVSEAKYYYEDGSLRKEEVYKDGKLAVTRHFDRRGDLQKEEVIDSALKPFKKN